MLVSNLNPVFLIVAIILGVITLIEWAALGRWGRVVGVTLAVAFLLMVNFHNL
jgi:hypothetical protein